MRHKRWLGIGGVVVAVGVAAGLGIAGGSSSVDDAVRVYLVHGAVEAERHGSQTTVHDGITVLTVGDWGNTWPTQVAGFLEDIDEHWVVIRKASGEDRKAEIHIPRERVQLIEHISEEYLRALLTAR